MDPLSTVVNEYGYIPYMGTDTEGGPDGRQTIKGPQRDRVAANIKELRNMRGRMSLAELSARLHSLGHPLRTTQIHKIERGERKVDVDDLVALALALDVSPNRLLLPGTADPYESVQLTSELSTTEHAAWRWARGRQTLYAVRPRPPGDWSGLVEETSGRLREFPRVNRPDIPPDPPTAQVGPHWGELQDLWQAASTLADKIGCSVDAVLRLVPDAEIVDDDPGDGDDGDS